MNTLLSGGSSIITIADLGTTLSGLNASFFDGQPQPFAQDHLVAPASVPGPVIGAGLPGLVAGCGGLFAWWRRRRKAA
jgi:hypothetical protein